MKENYPLQDLYRFSPTPNIYKQSGESAFAQEATHVAPTDRIRSQWHIALQTLIAQIKDYRMKAVLKLAEDAGEAPVHRPGGRHTEPAVKLFFEDRTDVLLQKPARLFLGTVLRYQIDRRFSSQILKAQLSTRGIYPMQPVQKWFRRGSLYRRSVNKAIKRE